MNLVIDQGNSRTKFAIFSNNKMVKEAASTHGEQVQVLSQLQKEYAPARCMLSSVADSHEIQAFLYQHRVILYVLDEATNLPFRNLYKSPKTLGKDRIAAIAGAHSLHQNKPCLVIDAGTAITYDFINEKSEYHGGSISPGFQMRFSALHHFTSKLPLADINPKVELPGTNTTESIQTGVMKGLLFEINGFISHYKTMAPNLLVFLTGGDAVLFDKSIKNSIFVAQNLVLLGLNSLLEHNAH